jgi:glycosidase
MQATPEWTKGAVCYEVFVRSFYDSNGDGIGDLNGLTQKLDYIQRLGVNCVWLMPVAASPSYHGYDATDYYRVEPDYGTNADFTRFVGAAHARGIRVLIDMVLNHASSEHPYFKDVLLKRDSPYRSWFRWSPTDPGIKGPWGQQVWHRSPVREEYYYGIFWSGMPDLNYETPAVREEAKRVARFWLEEMGVDGFRLDAVPYLVETGDSLAHTKGTHAFLHEYAEYIRAVKPDVFTVGEVWDSIGSMLPYYPDQLDAYFAFALSDAILDAVRTGGGSGGSAQKLLQGYLRLQDTLPAERWAPFQRNHDQTRTLTALNGDPTRARLAVTLLLTLPGLPFIYYGEEIGMTGDKPDPRLRTPMQWARAPAAGFTTARAAWEPLQPDSFTANVEMQEADTGSLLNLYRRLIHLRTDNPALASGRLVPRATNNDAVAAFERRSGDQTVLVMINLGKTVARLRRPAVVLQPGEVYLFDITRSARLR